MNKFSIFILVTFTLFYSACEEDFNPKTEFQEKYALFAIVQNQPQSPYTGLRVAILKTYNIDGYDPSKDHIDHSIPNAKVVLTIANKDYVLGIDTLKKITSSFTPRFTYSFFYNNLPPKFQDISIRAELPNGKVLSAVTKIPEQPYTIEFSYPFNYGIHTKLNQFIWGNTLIINWDASEDYLYFPKFNLNYWKVNGEQRTFNTVEIPLKYINKNGNNEPVYPSYTWGKQTEYAYACIDSVMNQISAGDTAKNRYHIQNISFSVREFETNLASYFSSTNGYLDNFSIRLDETVYSNVNGGLGVFGAYTTYSRAFKVERRYVESFGYTWIDYDQH